MRIQISLNKKEQQVAEKTLANIKSIFGMFKKFSDFVDGKKPSDEKKVGKIATINKMVRKPGAIVPSVKYKEEGTTFTVDFSEELTLDSLKITGRFFEILANTSMMFAPATTFAMQKWAEFCGECKEVNNKYERSQTVSYVDGSSIPEMLIDEINFDNPSSGAETELIVHHVLDTEFTTNPALYCDFGVANGIGKIFVHIDGNSHLVFLVDVSCRGESFDTDQFADIPGKYRIIGIHVTGVNAKPKDYELAKQLVRGLKNSAHIIKVLP